jgi:hypothetical protein
MLLQFHTLQFLLILKFIKICKILFIASPLERDKKEFYKFKWILKLKEITAYVILTNAK